jgi:hypothetical protein
MLIEQLHVLQGRVWSYSLQMCKGDTVLAIMA